jgi:hypothetical protein
MIAEVHPTTPSQRWARGKPEILWKRPGLPRNWVRVLKRHPEPMGLAGQGWPLPGYLWLDMPGKVRHVPSAT